MRLAYWTKKSKVVRIRIKNVLEKSSQYQRRLRVHSSMVEYPRVHCRNSRVCVLIEVEIWMTLWGISTISPPWLVRAYRPFSRSMSERWSYFTLEMDSEVFRAIRNLLQTWSWRHRCKVWQLDAINKWQCHEQAPWAMNWLVLVPYRNLIPSMKWSHTCHSTKQHEDTVQKIQENGSTIICQTMRTESKGTTVISSYQ